MLEKLPESRRQNRRAPGQLAASVAAHTVLIFGAVYATAHGQRREIEKPDRVFLAFHVPPATPQTTSHHTSAATLHHGPSIPAPISIPIAVPALNAGIDVHDIAVAPVTFPPTGPSLGLSQSLERLPTDGVYSADEVESPAAQAPGNDPPAYPERLRINGIEGDVQATFVIDTTGRVEQASIQFAKSGAAQFEPAVLAALRRMQFIPARVGNMKVRQLVTMPFVFRINR